jgi:hypothetical protein
LREEEFSKSLFVKNRLQLKYGQKPLIRNYSSTSDGKDPHNTEINSVQYDPVKIYANAYDMKKLILKENINIFLIFDSPRWSTRFARWLILSFINLFPLSCNNL